MTKRFLKGYHTIRDRLENKVYDFRVDKICNLLNELDSKYVDEFSLRETLQLELQRVEEENEQLKQLINEHGDSDVSSCMNTLFKLAKENEELKSALKQLKEIDDYQKGRIDELKEQVDYADDLIHSHLSKHFIRQWENIKKGDVE